MILNFSQILEEHSNYLLNDLTIQKDCYNFLNDNLSQNELTMKKHYNFIEDDELRSFLLLKNSDDLSF